MKATIVEIIIGATGAVWELIAVVVGKACVEITWEVVWELAGIVVGMVWWILWELAKFVKLNNYVK